MAKSKANTKSCMTSFVVDRAKAGLPKGRVPWCFWNVKATGRFDVDCVTGQTLALEYLDFHASGQFPPDLASIVADMPRTLTGVEVGFLETVFNAAKAGHRPAIRLSMLWTGFAKRAA